MSQQAPMVMVMAGGTGGHIFPGLAVAQAMQASGARVHWLGATGGMETRLVPAQGLAIDCISVQGVRGKGALALVLAPWRVARAVWAAMRVLMDKKPDAVISFGGFAAGPGGIAATLKGIPLIVHEQNRAAGMTNRVLAKLAKTILVGFPQTFAAEMLVGNPVRAAIAQVPEPEQRDLMHTGALRLLVLGGSQGARALNQSVPKALAKLAQPVDVLHQSGERMLDDAQNAYAQAGVEARVEPFIADMAAAYAWADVVVCRAGALTLAELCAVGVPSILVPFPQAVDDHQTRNAEYLVERGAALLLPQGDDLTERLYQTLQALMGDAEKRMTMAKAARALARPDAAQQVADVVLSLIASEQTT